MLRGMARRQRSAGILAWRRRDGALEVLLVHPGGPFWQRKDAGAWSIPKGEIDDGEEALAAARREFAEETGVAVDGVFVELPPCRLRSGKVVEAFAVEADLDVERMRSNVFELEWPQVNQRYGLGPFRQKFVSHSFTISSDCTPQSPRRTAE